jgi:hypothetical protein
LLGHGKVQPGEALLTKTSCALITPNVVKTHDTAKATAEAKPEPGQVCTYCDWQGKKLYGKPDAKTKKEVEVKTP